MQEQALRKAAELQHQAAKSAKEGLAGARLVAADIARGDAKSAGGRVGGWAHRASTSAGMLYVARLLVRAGRVKGVDMLSLWRAGSWAGRATAGCPGLHTLAHLAIPALAPTAALWPPTRCACTFSTASTTNWTPGSS